MPAGGPDRHPLPMDTTTATSTTTAPAVPSTPDPKIETIMRVYDAFGRGDLDAVLAEVADDVDWAAEASSASAPWYGRYAGKAEVPRFFQALGSSIEISEFAPLSFTSNDTDVMVAIRWTGRSCACSAGADPSTIAATARPSFCRRLIAEGIYRD